MKKFLCMFSLLLLLAVGASAQCSETTPEIEVVSLNIVKEALNRTGTFTIADGKQVYFTRGNLKYQASTKTWAFHDDQWAAIGNAPGNSTHMNEGRSTQSDWIDLFAFGTSGYHDTDDATNIHYEPWEIAHRNTGYSNNRSGFGPCSDLLGDGENLGDKERTKNYDWGIYNFVSTSGVYRVLSNTEWKYLLARSGGNLWGTGMLFGVNGLFLLPDDFDWNATDIKTAREAFDPDWVWTPRGRWSDNVIPESLQGEALWTAMENAGACFLPNVGYSESFTSKRDPTIDSIDVTFDPGNGARYWTSTVYASNNEDAYTVCINSGSVPLDNHQPRRRGRGVRLVQEVPTSESCNNFSGIKHPSVRGDIETSIDPDNHCSWTLTATPNSGYYFKQWSDGTTTNPLTITIDPDGESLDYVAEFVSGADTKIDAWKADSIFFTTNKANLDNTKASIYVNGVLNTSNITVRNLGYGRWGIKIDASLNTDVGQPLSIRFNDSSSGLLIAAADDVVPYVVSSDATLSSLSLSSGTNVEVVSGTLTVSADATLGVLNIHPGAIVKQTSGTLTVSKIIMRGDATTKQYPQFYVGGNVSNSNGDTIYYDYTLNYSHYYPLALPYTVTCSQIRTKEGKTPSYEVREYDGAERAQNVSGWKVYDDSQVDAEITAGKGYNIFAVPGKWWCTNNRPHKVTLRFPMHAVLSSGDAVTKYVPVALYNADGVTLPANANWNLICNPYLFNYQGDHDKLALGYYKKNDKGEWETIDHTEGHRYVTWSEDNFLSYTQALVTSTPIKAFYPYFVQAQEAGDLSFAKANRVVPSAPQRSWTDTEESADNTEYTMGLTLSKENISDRTGLLYSAKFSQSYETNADLVKIFGEQQPMSLYTIGADGEPRAFNALPVEDAAILPVPLAYRNAPLGTMQIAFDAEQYDMSAFEAVWLTDYQTNTTVNLLKGAYEFTNDVAASDTRFAVTTVIRKTPAVATDNETAIVSEQGSAVYYDMLGRRVSTSRSIPQGVYVVIENGNCRKEVVQ